jgi:hypothetical protein
MQVQQIMSKEVHIADPNMTIRDLARQMRADNIGSLPVGENDRLIGMVTDRERRCRGAFAWKHYRARGDVGRRLLLLRGRRCGAGGAGHGATSGAPASGAQSKQASRRSRCPCRSRPFRT